MGWILINRPSSWLTGGSVNNEESHRASVLTSIDENPERETQYSPGFPVNFNQHRQPILLLNTGSISCEGLTVNIEPRRVSWLACPAARDALVLPAVLGLHRGDVNVRYYVPVHSHVLANQQSVVLWKRKSIQQPGNLRGGITRGAAFQRNRWTGLHCLFDKPVDQLRRDLC